MSILRLIAILIIFVCTTAGWCILGGALTVRTAESSASTSSRVADGWGPAMRQSQPRAYYQSPGTRDGRAWVRPTQSSVQVDLVSEPRQKGLVYFRTYNVAFQGEYTFENTTPIPQTFFVQFSLPTAEASYNEFVYKLNDKPTTANISGSAPITEAVTLAPGARATLQIAYKTRGVNTWQYNFGEDSRVQNFELAMKTNFTEINFPDGTASPSRRTLEGNGYRLDWLYPDEIGARAIGMDMPNVLNPGPTAARITFFAPVSLLFFFAVLIILCLLMKIDLHPMNFFFLGAGCFAFQLLFAYLVDLIPMGIAFALSSLVSLALVSGYLLLAVGWRFARLAAVAQFSYMILFSYSFFFDGLTGLTITIGAIITLAILMVVTARIDWSTKFIRKTKLTPPPMPGALR